MTPIVKSQPVEVESFEWLREKMDQVEMELDPKKKLKFESRIKQEDEQDGNINAQQLNVIDATDRQQLMSLTETDVPLDTYDVTMNGIDTAEMRDLYDNYMKCFNILDEFNNEKQSDSLSEGVDDTLNPILSAVQHLQVQHDKGQLTQEQEEIYKRIDFNQLLAKKHDRAIKHIFIEEEMKTRDLRNPTPTDMTIGSDGVITPDVINDEDDDGEEIYSCHVCDKEYRWKSLLSRHMRLHKNSEEDSKKFSCHVCNKVFKHQSVLKLHMQSTHRKKRYFSCHVCDRKFRRKVALNRHMTKHDEDEKKKLEHEDEEDGYTDEEGEVSEGGVDEEKDEEGGGVGDDGGASGERVAAGDDGGESEDKDPSFVNNDSSTSTGGGNSFTCEVCHKSYIGERGLKRHMAEHSTSGNVFACTLCPRAYWYKSELKRHMAAHNKKTTTAATTPPQQYPCQVCGLTFEQKPLLALHMNEHSNNKHKTENSNKSITNNNNNNSKKSLSFQFPVIINSCNTKPTEHTKQQINDQKGKKGGGITGDQLFTCGVCNRKYTNKYSLKNHFQTHLNSDELTKSRRVSFEEKVVTRIDVEEDVDVQENQQVRGIPLDEKSSNRGNLTTPAADDTSCYFCLIPFQTQAQLDQHLLEHTCKEGLFACNKCDKKYDVKTTLKRHIANKHPSKYTPSCNVCGEKFGYIADLKRHNMTKHSVVSNVFSCTVCGREFFTEQRLKKHMRQVHLDDNLTCTVCQKVFQNKQNLNQHLLLHSSEKDKKLVCQVCNKSFVHKARLLQHMTVHSPQRAYTCDKCNLHFSYQSTLNHHISAVHLNGPPMVIN